LRRATRYTDEQDACSRRQEVRDDFNHGVGTSNPSISRAWPCYAARNAVNGRHGRVHPRADVNSDDSAPRLTQGFQVESGFCALGDASSFDPPPALTTGRSLAWCGSCSGCDERERTPEASGHCAPHGACLSPSRLHRRVNTGPTPAPRRAQLSAHHVAELRSSFDPPARPCGVRRVTARIAPDSTSGVPAPCVALSYHARRRRSPA
jgi:hypothetical protein